MYRGERPASMSQWAEAGVGGTTTCPTLLRCASSGLKLAPLDRTTTRPQQSNRPDGSNAPRHNKLGAPKLCGRAFPDVFSGEMARGGR